MEKQFLLEELANLEGIVKKYEMSLKSKACQDKINTSLDCHYNSINNKQLIKDNSSKSTRHTHKSMVFINPNKLIDSDQINYVRNKNQHDNIPNKQQSLKNDIIKVFINPDFKKSLPLNNSDKKETACTTINSPQKEYTSNSVCKKYFQDTRSMSLLKKGLISETQQFQNGGALKEGQTCSNLKNKCKIFINPNYTKPTVMDSNNKIVGSCNPKAREVNLTAGNPQPKYVFKPDTKVTLNAQNKSEISRTVSKTDDTKTSKKRNNFVNTSKTSKDPMLHEKERHGTPNITIFLNPNFKGGIQNITNRPNTNGNLMAPNTIPVHITHNYTNNNAVGKLSSHETCSSTSNADFSNRCLKTIETIKGDGPAKFISKRKTSCSTSLVAVSATKLIRKRKPSQRFESNTKTNLKKSSLLSKTKLVCTSPSKSIKNKIVEKAKVKRVVPIAQLQLLTPDKINKLRKQSFVNSITNLVNVVPNCASVTKIKSKNGKSMRLVRKMDESQKSITDLRNKNKLNAVQNQKSTLKDQLRKNVLCVVKSVGRRQFSKINVEQTNNKITYPRNESKYVYKSRDYVPKQNKAPSALSTKQLLQTPIKSKHCNHLSEKYKFIRSKYRFIKKQNYKLSWNKNYRSKKAFKNTNQHLLTSRNLIRRKLKLQNYDLNKAAITKSKSNHIRKKLSIVNIGGIFYRCSRTSLTRNKTPKKVPQVTQKQSQDLLLNIHGQKFQLENNGQILRCLDSAPRRKRIDIGGVTFVTTSCGSSLIRTNYHTARSIIVQAKQKSLSQLTKKLRKNNEPCPFYHRLGRCIGKDRGTCVRQHDPKYITVCKRFIQGLCNDAQCLLAHKISCHNMPTCQHFLAGHCGKDHCPYPHIKVSDNAPICLDFLRGFCAQGDQCTKRHFQICPSFEKGMCPRGKYCPYPHPKSKTELQLRGKFKHLQRKIQPPRNPEPVSSSSLRYFEDVNLQKEKDMQQSENLKESEDCPSEEEEKDTPIRKRPKLGRLPSYIPLTFDGSFNASVSEETSL